MRSVRVTVALVALVALSAGCQGTPPSQSQTDSEGTVSVEAVDTEEIEEDIHRIVNEERVERNLDRLDWDRDLHDIASYHSERMVRHDFYAHTGPNQESVRDRYSLFNYDCSIDHGEDVIYGGENIARTLASGTVVTDYGEANHRGDETSIARGIVKQWLNSPDHRETMLADHWNTQAIGVEVTRENGKLWVYATENFC